MGNSHRFGSVLLWFSGMILLSATACAPATPTITPPPPDPAATPTQIPLYAILLVTNAITPTHLALSGSTLVWTDHRNGNADIYGYDLETGHEFPIATGPAYQQQPDVHGQLVVWAEPDAIYGHRLDTGRRLRLVDVQRPRNLHLAWPYVVWTEGRSDPGHVMAPLYITPTGVVALDLTTGVVPRW